MIFVHHHKNLDEVDTSIIRNMGSILISMYGSATGCLLKVALALVRCARFRNSANLFTVSCQSLVRTRDPRSCPRRDTIGMVQTPADVPCAPAV